MVMEIEAVQKDIFWIFSSPPPAWDQLCANGSYDTIIVPLVLDI